MLVTQEQREDYKERIRRVMIFHPYITVVGLQKMLAEATPPLALSYPYLTELAGEIRAERTKRYLEETRDEVVSKFEDLVEFVNSQLRRIAQEEKIVEQTKGESGKSRVFSQRNRIEALKQIVANYKDLGNFKMDLGVLERRLGTVSANVRVLDILQAVKEMRNGTTGGTGIVGGTNQANGTPA